jgi:hypothetical protein
LQSDSGGVGGKLIGGSSINDNQWHHIVVGSYYDTAASVYKGKVYVDGVESTTTVSSYSRSASYVGTGIIFGGSYSYTNEQYFDQIRIFNKTLTQTEVDVLHSELANALVATGSYHVGVTNTSGRIDSQYFTDINGMTAAQSAGTGTVNYAVSTDGRTTWNVNKGTDGVRPIVRNNSGTWQYNNNAGVEAGYQLASASYNSKFLNSGASSGFSSVWGIHFNTNGTKVFVVSTGSTDAVYEYDLSTAYDISTASYNNVSFNVNSQLTNPKGLDFNSDGTKMYLVGQDNDTVYQYTLSTGFDLSTASYANKSFSVSSQEATPYSVLFNNTGSKMYINGNSNDTLYQYSLSTNFDVSTASYNSVSYNLNSVNSNPRQSVFNSDGTKLYNVGTEYVFEFSLSTAYDISTISYNNVNYRFYQIIGDGSGVGLAFNPDGTKMYVAGGDTVKVYQFSTGASSYSTSATWANGTVNDELYTLQQALGAQSHNRMDKTQLDAVADANHFATGTSLDLMIALRMDTAANTLPTSDGVTLNYDAASLNEGAVLGTDYDFFHPAANKVQIKSLAAQNLKVRVV